MICPRAITKILIPVLLALGAGPADDRKGDVFIPPDAIEVSRCDLEFELSTMVGANTGTAGAVTLLESFVQLGDKVKAGQVLGRLNDRELQARLASLEAVANSDIDVKVTDSRMRESAMSFKRLESLRQRSKTYTSEDEYGRVRLEAETAALQAEQAKHRQRTAKLDCLEIKAQIQNREIVSPHDGTVVEIYKKVGESVTANETVYQVINTDIMRVTGFLNLEQYGLVSPGQEIQIYPESDGFNSELKKLGPITGKVTFVDRRVDAKTRTSKIVAQIEHATADLPSGIEAKMIILPKSSTSPNPPSGPTASSTPPSPTPVAATTKPPAGTSPVHN